MPLCAQPSCYNNLPQSLPHIVNWSNILGKDEDGRKSRDKHYELVESNEGWTTGWVIISKKVDMLEGVRSRKGLQEGKTPLSLVIKGNDI